MVPLTVTQKSSQPLADQIVAGIRRQVVARNLRPGAKLPSIRKFAESHNVSRFTVVEADDRLVAMGYLQSRRGAGFYVAPAVSPAPPGNHRRSEHLAYMMRQAGANTLLAGGPWLPNEWLDEPGIRQGLRLLARKSGAHLLEYGDPLGYLPLREQLALMLDGHGISAHPSQILLTQGASQALELVIGLLLKPGDAALVDDPGYFNLFGNLRLKGVRMLAVPGPPEGPDLAVLETMATACRPKVFFTQSVMQNPTGTDILPRVAFKLLQAADRHNFLIVEDDVFCDLQVKATDQLRNARSPQPRHLHAQLSKTLSASLRVGFLACAQEIANDLADIKMLTSIAASQFTERLIYSILVDGHYRKYLGRLQERLGEARVNVVRALERIGLELFAEPADGIYVWARFPHIDDATRLAESSLREHRACAGAAFRPHLERSPWMRFNVAICEDRRVQDWLQRQAADKPQ